MMIDMIKQPEDFKQWFGRFVTTPRHELDIAPVEPPYTVDEVAASLQAGEILNRLSGLRVLEIDGSFFINSECHNTVDTQAMDVLCRDTDVDPEQFGEALNNPAFVAELTGLINQGYWFYDEE